MIGDLKNNHFSYQRLKVYVQGLIALETVTVNDKIYKLDVFLVSQQLPVCALFRNQYYCM